MAREESGGDHTCAKAVLLSEPSSLIKSLNRNSCVSFSKQPNERGTNVYGWKPDEPRFGPGSNHRSHPAEVSPFSLTKNLLLPACSCHMGGLCSFSTNNPVILIRS